MRLTRLIAFVLGASGALTLSTAAFATDPYPGGDPGGIHTITRDKAKILKLLNGAGWVSPHLGGKALWMISFRSCPDCVRFEKEQFDDLHRANIDTRVIVVARRSKSTPAERTGVGELWAKRSWKTFEDWTSIPVDAFTGEGMASGDTDPARAALVEKGRVFIDELTPLLAENGLPMHYPTLIWQDPKGRLRGCACEERETYSFFRNDLGVKDRGVKAGA